MLDLSRSIWKSLWEVNFKGTVFNERIGYIIDTETGIKPSMELGPNIEYRLGLKNVNVNRDNYNQTHDSSVQLRAYQRLIHFILQGCYKCFTMPIWSKDAPDRYPGYMGTSGHLRII